MLAPSDLAETVNAAPLPQGCGWLVLEETSNGVHLLLIHEEDETWIMFMAHSLPDDSRIVVRVEIEKWRDKLAFHAAINLRAGDLLRQVGEWKGRALN